MVTPRSQESHIYILALFIHDVTALSAESREHRIYQNLLSVLN